MRAYRHTHTSMHTQTHTPITHTLSQAHDAHRIHTHENTERVEVCKFTLSEYSMRLCAVLMPLTAVLLKASLCSSSPACISLHTRVLSQAADQFSSLLSLLFPLKYLLSSSKSLGFLQFRGRGYVKENTELYIVIRKTQSMYSSPELKFQQ